MKRLPSIVTSVGVATLVLAATTAGIASATTEPVDPVSSAAPGDMAPGCVEITALLDAEASLETAFLAEDGATFGAIIQSLPAFSESAIAAAPPEIADAVATWLAPLADLPAMIEGVDLTDFDAMVQVFSSMPPAPESQAAGDAVTAWATENCGRVGEMFAEAAEPQPCETLDPSVAADAAGLDIDVSDADGSGDINLSSYWSKSCSYGNGAISLSTISFTSIEQATEFFADNMDEGEYLDVELGSLPPSTLVTVQAGLLAVTVFEATVPFSVGFNADEVTPEAAVAAAQAVLAGLPTEVPPPPMSSEAP